MKRASRAILSLAIVLPIAAASLHSICDLYFDCGCLPLWAGGFEHCDIHDLAPPNCPWCSGSTFYAVAAGCAIGVAAGVWAGIRLSSSLFVPIVLAFVGYGAATWIASLL